MCLKFGFVIFWQKDFGAKAAHKMLVKLTPVYMCDNNSPILQQNAISNLNFSGKQTLENQQDEEPAMHESTVCSLLFNVQYVVICLEAK
jgi:hypothetical protein